MSFGQDLVAAGYSFFRFVEVVGEKSYNRLDKLYDRRVARILAESKSTQFALSNLQRHFSPKHVESLRSFEKFTDYLVGSFQSALSYRRPYSSANVHGLPFDALSIVDNDRAKLTFADATLRAGRMAAMGLLVVHYITLEYTVMLAHIEDSKTQDDNMMDPECVKEFYEIMGNIYEYEKIRQEAVERVYGVMATEADRNEMFIKMITGVIDVSMQRGLSAPMRTLMFEDNEYTSVFIRSMYYSVMLDGLSLYGKYRNDLKDTKVKQLYLFTEGLLTDYRKFGLNQHGPIRIMEDRNCRDILSKKFKSFTDYPVYEYSTLPYPSNPTTRPGTMNDVVIQKTTAGLVSVTPRIQVHIWRNKLEWTDEDNKIASMTIGEVGLMWDLMYTLPAIVATNWKFRTTSRYPYPELHSLFTRFFGPFDVMKAGANVLSMPIQGMIRNIARYRDSRAAIRDPVVPTSTSIQPMPEALSEWTIAQSDLHDPNQISMVSNAVFQRAYSINTSETLKISNTDPSRSNVVWVPNLLPESLQKYYGFQFKNSIFMLHVGEALQNIDQHICCEGPGVMGDMQRMTLNRTTYLDYHAPAPDVPNGVFTITYKSIKDMRAEIREQSGLFTKLFNARGAGFLHPSCWIAPNTDWKQVNASKDLVPGTVVHFSPLGGAPVAPTADQTALADAVFAFTPEVFVDAADGA
jgi:hypothetical protein